MKLKAFLRQSGWTDADMASALVDLGLKRASKQGVGQIKNRVFNAGLGIALAIEKVTEGQVRAEDLPLSRDSRRAMRQIRQMVWDAEATVPSTSKGGSK